MMRPLLQRTVITLASTVALGAFGILGGYMLGRAIALRQAEGRLDQYANRVLTEAAASTAESRAVLARMNASPHPFCSEMETIYFRELIFSSRFLKAAGRMRDGMIECSTTFGRSSKPQPQFQPGLSRQDGTRVYRDLAEFRVDDQTVITIQLGDSFVVYNPYNFNPLTALPIRYAFTAIDPASRQTGPTLGDLPYAHGQFPSADGRGRAGGSLFSTHCSREIGACLTAYISIPDAMRGSQRYCTACMLLGGVIGALFGLMCPFLYRRNKSVEQQLIRAIRADALSVVYQPIVDLATGKMVEAEALVRWTDEYKNAVSPDVFVRIAEERGFVGEITRLVIRHVLRDFGSTMRARPDFRVNVNIAAADLADSAFLPMIQRALDDAEIVPRSLGIEITESYTARQQAAKETILSLRHRGHFVHIDDFGTGYSSLAYLHDLSVDAIKIDKAFTKAIGTDAVTVTILPQILTMAKTLNLRVVVEGIESQAQADYFAASDQNIHAQGWLFGRPVPARLFLQMMDEEESGKRCREQAAEIHHSLFLVAH
jgi:sensor c-di-GMP phosphodiesterase-like protein